jgi:hypothetical protein
MTVDIRKELLRGFYDHFRKVVEKYNTSDTKITGVLFDVVSTHYDHFKLRDYLFLTKSDLFYVIKNFNATDYNVTILLKKIKAKRDNLANNLYIAYETNYQKSNRLIIRNLPTKIKVEHIKLFCDNIKNIYISKEKCSNINFNIAIIDFFSIEDAEKALQLLHFKEVLGYLLVVYYLNPTTEDEEYYRNMHILTEEMIDVLGMD